MAVAPTGAIYKSLYFDGEDSRDYGVYITGEAVYNAPEREVEMISIPGRNGALAMDRGRFENIEVTYPAGIFADNEADFAEAISNFRNLLCSKRGYVRLQDEYNPNEYRMAIYKSGLEVDTALLKAGEFDIVFDCKPQRFLTSGEEAVTVTSGGTLTNPTLFEASPLLMVDGYGTVSFNNYVVNIMGGAIGLVTVLEDTSFIREGAVIDETFTFDTQYANAGDNIYFRTYITDRFNTSGSFSVRTGPTFSGNFDWTPTFAGQPTFEAWMLSDFSSTFVFQYGTPHEYQETGTGSYNSNRYQLNGNARIIYDGASSIRVYIETTITTTTSFNVNCWASLEQYRIELNSSQSILGHPLYIDCDIGECYKFDGGVPVSINSGISLGSDLPKLASGANEITYDNTIVDLKVVPRWWKI